MVREVPLVWRFRRQTQIQSVVSVTGTPNMHPSWWFSSWKKRYRRQILLQWSTREEKRVDGQKMNYASEWIVWLTSSFDIAIISAIDS